MGLEELVNGAAASVITEEDRIMHTQKMVERAFGRPVSDLGEVTMKDGQAVLSFDYAGAKHTLRWARQSSGAIFWFVDDSAKPLVLGQQERAISRLHEALGG
jgi:hypothetical protein